MRNKFLKGLSVAFAAAMAFTVVAPALTTEAASTKATVVSEMMDENGNVTKYTYDSRGRVTKKVTTNTDATSKTITGNATDTTNPSSSDYVITTVNVNGSITTTRVDAMTYDNELTTITIDGKTVTTETYTYYNSGKKKDKVKTKSVVMEDQNIVAGVSSSNSDNTYGYINKLIATEDVDYTYDAAGNLIKEVSVAKEPTNYTYALITAGSYVTQAWIDSQNAASHGLDITEETKVYTNNSNGQKVKEEVTTVIGSHQETWLADNSAKVDGSDVDTLTKNEGDTYTYKYNKMGFPTKVVYTMANKRSTGTPSGYTTTNDLADTVSTISYTYGKDLQLNKRVVTLKNPALAMLTGTYAGVIRTTVTDPDGNVTTVSQTAPAFTNDQEITTTYNYDLKEGTTCKTYETRMSTTKTNGIAQKQFNTATFKYTLKKISVPSSRAEGIMREQAMIQTDL